MNKPVLTIGMATYDDYDGVYFTIQSLRMHHEICKTDSVQFIIVDNNPSGPHALHVQDLANKISNVEYIGYDQKRSTSVRNEIFRNARGAVTMAMDCHVLLWPDSIDYLLKYFDDPENHHDIVTGPLLYDDLQNVFTHFRPGWNAQMYGTWAIDSRYQQSDPFEIPMNGCGLFATRTDHWLGFNEHFIGFGGEEWYIQEKYRQHGGRAMCIPQLKWLHRFTRPHGVPYPNRYEHRVSNYYTGWLELYGAPSDPMVQSITDHFESVLPRHVLDQILIKSCILMNIDPNS